MKPGYVPLGVASPAVESALLLYFPVFDIAFSHLSLRLPSVSPVKRGSSSNHHG
jgi:hypothetical protein